MIRICLIILSIIFTLTEVSAQANLQFNQVLLVGNTLQTVPSGKVWKVESALYSSSLPSVVSSGSGSGTYANSNDLIEINGASLIIRSLRSGGGYYHASAVIWEQHFPIWLYPGHTLKASTGVHALNVIEFSTIP
jgi:hypothetical protein